MLLVRDIMEPNVETVSPEMTIREVARFWARHGISGAPVVDASGRLLGVVSTTDLVRLTAEEPTHPDHLAAQAPSYPPEEEEEEGEEASWYYFMAREAPSLYAGGLVEELDELVDQVTVRDIMTPVIFDIRPEATVAELAGFLLRGKIHRALVVEEGELVGIVTSFDVLRVVADTPIFGGEGE